MHDPSVEQQLHRLSQEASELQDRLDALRSEISYLRHYVSRPQPGRTPIEIPIAEPVDDGLLVDDEELVEASLTAPSEIEAPGAAEAASASPAAPVDFRALLDHIKQPRGEPRAVYGAPSEAQPADAGRETAELVFGRTWLNRIGAVILFLGVAFFIKYSFDQGWISPTMRVVLGAAAGMALVCIGEILLRRDMRPVAAGVLGAGIGTLYASAFGAYNFYHLVGPGTAFALYCLVTAASVAIALRANLLALAVLAAIGGYGTPILLSTGSNQQAALLTYVLVLDLAFLMIAELRRWDVLRPLAWLGTSMLFLGWAWKFYHVDAMWQTWVFLAVFYGVFHASAVFANRRGRAVWPQLLAAIIHADNAVFFFATYLLWRDVVPDWLGLFAVILAGLQWLLAWRVVPRTVNARPVGLGLWLGGAAMLAMAAPLQFDRYLVSVSWCAQAVVTFAFCRKFPERWLRLKGVAVWVAATVHLFMFERIDLELTAILWQLGYLTLSWTIVLFAAAAFSALAVSSLLVVGREADHDDRSLAAIFAVAGTLLFMWTTAYDWERYLASWWWIGIAAAWGLTATRVAAARWIALGAAAACAVKFFAWDTLEATGGAWSQIQGVALNRVVLTGLAAALLMYCTRRVLIRSNAGSTQNPDLARLPMADVLTWVALVILTWTGTFEIFRAFRFEEELRAIFAQPGVAKLVAITIFWAVNASVLWRLARTAWRNVTYYSLLMTVLVSIKYCVVDTWGLVVTNDWAKVSGLVFNAPFLAGVSAATAVSIGYVRMRSFVKEPALRLPAWLIPASIIALALLAMWIPTFEISRVFRFEPFRERFADPSLAMHLVLSILWSVNATVFLLIGFARRIAVLRYAALGVYGLTVVKVFLFDSSRLETIYRVISFVVLGVLLLFASVLYQRLSTKMTLEKAGAQS